MAENQFRIAERYRNTDTSDVKVYLTVSGSLQRPVSESTLREFEQAAYGMSFNARGSQSVDFVVSLPDDWNLTYGEATRIDNAIFKGLIERGRKGSRSSLDRYPPSKD